MSRIHSYASIYNLGHPALSDLYDGPVIIEEKLDGSQFSFGLVDGQVFIRSKRKEMPLDAPESLFVAAAESVRWRERALRPGWVYRAEYLAKPKHNTIAYARVPKDHLAIFDVEDGPNRLLPPQQKVIAADEIGLECVPMFHHGEALTFDDIKLGFLERESCLGGSTIEGVVIKNPARFGPDKKPLMGKFVREDFKERNAKVWREANPGRGDIIQALGDELHAEARWIKAVQHLRDDGELSGTPQDIGLLIREIQADLERECADEIRTRLYREFWPQIRRKAMRGIPEWYKEFLARGGLS